MTAQEIQQMADAFEKAMQQYYGNKQGSGGNGGSSSAYSINGDVLSFNQVVENFKTNVEALSNKIPVIIRDFKSYATLDKEIKDTERAFKNALKDLKDAKKSDPSRKNKGLYDFEIKRIEHQKKLYDLDKEIENEQRKYAKEIFETSELRKKNEKESLERNSLDQSKREKLNQIEISAQKEHIKDLREVYKKEIDIKSRYADRMAAKEVVDGKVKNVGENIRGRMTTKNGHVASFSEMWNMYANFREEMVKNSWQRNVGIATKYAGDKVNSGLNTINSGKMDVGSMANSIAGSLSKLGPWGGAAGSVVQIFKTLFDMYAKVDKAASDYARSVGGGTAAMVKMRQASASLAAEFSNFGKMAYQAEEILAAMAETSEAIGRNMEYMSSASIKSMVDLKRFGIGTDVIAQYDTFGVSIGRLSSEINDLYNDSGKKGLNAKAVIKAFTTNLKMAQNYTFARGRKALMDMAEKSAQLKFNLRDAEAFANKVSTLEGAMKAGAALSVLGGQFAMQGNPLTMLYNGLNDVEGLQRQMLQMTKGMANWDSRKGQLDISSFDRERLKAMSEATGIDYSDLTTQAFNQARIDRVSAQLGGGFSKETAEYIKNIAELDKNGNAFIQFHDKNGNLEDRTYTMNEIRNRKDLQDRLKGESESKDRKENATVGDILNSTRSIQDYLDDIVGVIKTNVVNALMTLVEHVTGQAHDGTMRGVSDQNNGIFKKMAKDMDNFSIEDNHSLWRQLGLDTKKMEKLEDVSYYAAKDKLANAFVQMQSAGYHYDERSNSFINDKGERYKANDDKNVPEFKFGGFTGYGDSNEIAGVVHKGEYVFDADTTKQMFSNVKNGDNLMKPRKFAQEITNNSTSNTNTNVTVSPVKIEFAPLELKMDNISKTIESSQLANILLNNTDFVNMIIEKIATAKDFGRNKNESANPFATPIWKA